MSATSEVWALASADRIKSAALLVDRVWVPPAKTGAMRGGLLQRFVADYEADQPPEEVRFSAEDEWNEHLRFWMGNAYNSYQLEDALIARLDDLGPMIALRGPTVVRIYSADRKYPNTYTNSTDLTYQAAIDNLNVADESRLTWRQVLDFREDKDALVKYRNLRLWLRNGLAASSLAEASDKIAQTVDDYAWAVKKHGLETRIGLLSELLDHRTAMIAAGGTAVGAATGHELIAALTSGLAIAAKITVSLARRAIEGQSLWREHTAKGAAVIYDARQLEGRSR
jgi:hypothetical protein